MITLISTPAYTDPVDPTLICRWLATEGPNNFRMLRRDYIVSGQSDSAGFWRGIFTENFAGNAGDDIAIYDSTFDTMYVGKVVSIAAPDTIITDIPWVPFTYVTYVNDNTLYGGYYFEGRLTVNGVLYPLTIIASPDSFGYADLDVSGISGS